MKTYPHPVFASICATRSGRVFSQGRELHGATDSSGYTQINIRDIGKLRQKHRIVYECVTGKELPPYQREGSGGLELNHDDGDKTNNRFSNLELVTHQSNVQHSWQVLGNRQSFASGEKCAMAKLSYEDVVKILKLLAKGKTALEIGGKFGVHPSNITNIKNGKAYKPETERAEKELGLSAPGKTIGVTKHLVKRVLRRLRLGWAGTVIADHYNVSQATVSSIKTGKYDHLLAM
ncbi:HNH endonuclease [Pseudomonas phage vB_PpuM-Peetri]